MFGPHKPFHNVRVMSTLEKPKTSSLMDGVNVGGMAAMAKGFTIQHMSGFLGHVRPPLTRINPRKGGCLTRKPPLFPRKAPLFPRKPPRVRGSLTRKGCLTRGALRGKTALRGPRVRLFLRVRPLLGVLEGGGKMAKMGSFHQIGSLGSIMAPNNP